MFCVLLTSSCCTTCAPLSTVTCARTVAITPHVSTNSPKPLRSVVRRCTSTACLIPPTLILPEFTFVRAGQRLNNAHLCHACTNYLVRALRVVQGGSLHQDSVFQRFGDVFAVAARYN